MPKNAQFIPNGLNGHSVPFPAVGESRPETGDVYFRLFLHGAQNQPFFNSVSIRSTRFFRFFLNCLIFPGFPIKISDFILLR